METLTSIGPFALDSKSKRGGQNPPLLLSPVDMAWCRDVRSKQVVS